MSNKHLIYIILTGLFTVPAFATPYLNPNNGNYYEVFWKQGGYTWNEAHNEANNRSYAGLQGHLATITSQSEFNWITDNLDYEGTFIGGTDMNNEGTWQWVTGETFSFTAWEPGEPNTWEGNDEDYLMFWWENEDDNYATAGWNDTVNDPYSLVGFELGYIVEYDGLSGDVSNVPVPAAVWLFGTAFLGMVSIGRRRR